MITAICLSVSSFAQQKKQIRLSAGPEVAYTASDNIIFWGTGIGGSAQAEYFFNEKISAAFFTGYASYLGVSILGGTKFPALHVVPVRIGGRYYFTERIYLGGQAGVGFLSGGGLAASVLGAKGTSFSYSPQAGYLFKINKKKRIDATVKYEGFHYTNGNFNSTGLRLAYIF